MTYEAFLASWNDALQRSRLPPMGFPRSTLDLETLDRVAEVQVEPMGGQFAEPFFVTAQLSFRWSALLTARARTVDEDVLVELLGRPEAADLGPTERPWVRVDIHLSATLPLGKPMPMPAPASWARWAREVTARFELEPVAVDDDEEDPESDLFTIGAWQGSPSATFGCGEDGGLSLDGISLEAWQAVRVPRKWDDPDRERDEPPDAQLDRMMGRVRSALHVWSEVLDHLRADRRWRSLTFGGTRDRRPGSAGAIARFRVDEVGPVSERLPSGACGAASGIVRRPPSPQPSPPLRGRGVSNNLFDDV